MTNERILEVLKQARGLIDRPEKWIKLASANEHFTKFCATGAVAHVVGDHGHLNGDPVLRYSADALHDAVPHLFESVVEYNDAPETTHADIMDLFDRAIAIVETRKPAAVEAREEEEVFA